MSDRAAPDRARHRGKKGKVERRRARRLVRSTEISLARAEPIVHAALHALRTERPLNRFITIGFEAGGCPVRTIEALGQFLKSGSDWLRWKGAPVAYVWVIENPPAIDEHAHVLIHVPDNLSAGFTRLQRGWLARTGTTCWRGIIHTEKVMPSHEALTGVLRYVLKGGDAETRKIFGIEDRGRQGHVEGKRCGMSGSLGASAREREIGFVGPSERPTSGNRNLTKPVIRLAPSSAEAAK